MPELRSRIKELRHVRAADIEGAPWNWRTHPEAQVDILADSIDELGFLDPLDVRELPGGKYQLFDGHARLDLIYATLGPDTLVPVNVTDLTEQEAKWANLTKDPLAQMAETNQQALASLAAQVGDESAAVAAMLEQMRLDLDAAAPFQPALEPAASSGGYTREDVEREQERLQDRFTDTKKLRPLTCPACGGHFEIDR